MEQGKTQIKRLEQYKDRWTSFGSSTGILEISEKPTPAILKQYAIFKEFDDKFLEKISPDVSIARWKKGSVLFEEGSYLDVAFQVISGELEVSFQKMRAGGDEPIFNRSRTVVVGPGASQPRSSGYQTAYQGQIQKQERNPKAITFLSSIDFNLPSDGKTRLGAGEFVGELRESKGWPQSVTVKTVADCELLQIRVAALRIMRKRSTNLKNQLDKLYRERSLFTQLKTTPLFSGMSDDFIQSLTQSVELISCEPDEVIAREGESVDALYLLRSGFIKLSQRLGEGNVAVSYLSKGGILGSAEILIEGMGGWICTATSKEYSELVKISRGDFLKLLEKYPAVEPVLWDAVVRNLKESGYSRRVVSQSEFIDTALNKGLVEGNSILVIDLNVCTRCDDCVRGCADTHEGIPRFVREGDKVGNFLITRACYHCEDPVCLVGCPTGAIRRTDVGDVVAIDDKLCIGCSTCSNNCPYDAITMYETGTQWPADMIPEGLRGKDQQLATKCDLCYQDSRGPACVRSCPHGCAVRVGDIKEFKTLIIGSV